MSLGIFWSWQLRSISVNGQYKVPDFWILCISKDWRQSSRSINKLSQPSRRLWTDYYTLNCCGWSPKRFHWNVEQINRNHPSLLLLSQSADYSYLQMFLWMQACSNDLTNALSKQTETPAEAVDIVDTGHGQLAFTGIHDPAWASHVYLLSSLTTCHVGIWNGKRQPGCYSTPSSSFRHSRHRRIYGY